MRKSPNKSQNLPKTEGEVFFVKYLLWDFLNFCLQNFKLPPVILILSCCVPQAQGDRSPVDHEWCGVGVEHGGDVLAGEGVGGVGDEEAGLPNGAVAHHDALDCLHPSLFSDCD